MIDWRVKGNDHKSTNLELCTYQLVLFSINKSIQMDAHQNKFHGCIIGFSIGDALGSPLEFSDRDSVCLFNEMERNYHYNLPAGYWTEKTSELLCSSTSLIENRRFVKEDFISKYHDFITNGSLTPLEKPFEVNQYMKITALKIGLLVKYKKHLITIINPNDHQQIDCEPLFRISPLILTHYMEPHVCMKYIEDLCRTTHVSPICIGACKFYANLMIGALMGVTKEKLLSENFDIMDITTYGVLQYNKITHKYLANCTDTILTLNNNNQKKITCKSTKQTKFIRSLFPAIIEIQKGSYKKKKRDQIKSDNNIVNCLEAALWAFYSTNTFEEGCIVAVNLGVNANAIGAIYGQLAGIYYGFTQIPQKWISKLHKFPYLYEISLNLFDLGLTS